MRKTPISIILGLVIVCSSVCFDYSIGAQIPNVIDGDNDYVPDLLENELAIKFRPMLKIATNDLLEFYPTQILPRNIPFSVEIFEGIDGNYYLLISDGILFTQDMGLPVPASIHR